MREVKRVQRKLETELSIERSFASLKVDRMRQARPVPEGDIGEGSETDTERVQNGISREDVDDMVNLRECFLVLRMKLFV